MPTVWTLGVPQESKIHRRARRARRDMPTLWQLPVDPTIDLSVLCGGSCFLAEARTCEVRFQSIATRLRSDHGRFIAYESRQYQRQGVLPAVSVGRRLCKP